MKIADIKRDMKKETTLSQIAQEPKKADHSLLFGVIIDVSEPRKYKEKDNYTLSLKIIDPSFNYQQAIQHDNLKFHKFVKVNIYSEDPINLPRVQYIGDIIRLRRFKFLYSEKGSLIANMQKYSNWLIYQGSNFKERVAQCDPYTPFQFMKRDQNENRELLDYEKGRIEDLRKWSLDFFSQSSITYIDWWNNIQKQDEVSNFKEVDMFLKVQAVDPQKKTIYFENLLGDQYYAKMNTPDINTVNHIIKLRCINLKLQKSKGSQKKYKIDFTEKSSSIYLPSYSLDYQKFFFQSKNKSKNSLLQLYNWLANYNLEDIILKNKKITPIKNQKDKFVTTYKKINHKKVTTAKKLQEILNKPAMYKNERFIFEGRIVGFSEENPQKFLKVMNIQSKKFFDFNEIKLEANMDKKYRVFIHLQVQIMDETVQSPLDIYISTTEGDHHLFETWEIIPPSDRIALWADLPDRDIKFFKSTLKVLKEPENKVKLCLQLMITNNGKSFLKLVDTIFLPL